MRGDSRELVEDVLDLLVDGACPFSGAFRTLRRFGVIGPGVSGVEALWALACELHLRGLAQLRDMAPDGRFVALPQAEWADRGSRYAEWLPDADPSELSVDQVAVWLEITSEGRAEWARLGSMHESWAPRWMVDIDADSSCITIHAPALADLDAGLAWWLRREPAAQIVKSTIRDDMVESYVLRDGTRILGGARRTARYRLERKNT